MSDYQDFNWSPSEAYSTNYILPKIIELLDKKKNKCILDLGCGNGLMTKAILEMGYDIYGIDASETVINIASKSHPNRFFLQDISDKNLPVEIIDKKFDTIISTEVIEHIYNPYQYLAFCSKIFENNRHEGQLILSTPYHGYLKNLALAVSGKMDFHYHPLSVGGHIKFWSKNTLGKLLTECGYEVKNFQGAGRLPYLWKSMIVVGERNKKS
ncbi:methyltransferase domain protein [Sporocytophaga myxococcoides]|uniref:Methyltransferase domain protein n=1 Tax=Sporocytophaga myxococcoides TaxID=153721 RepID=A0A098LCS8_9BACT|nr:class I SAM-dependent methyltransferase [Sporocytophaga myxococcoides]GAL84068.1 methyltransferase domain protein [Sporocytophaga myxococcoides]